MTEEIKIIDAKVVIDVNSQEATRKLNTFEKLLTKFYKELNAGQNIDFRDVIEGFFDIEKAAGKSFGGISATLKTANSNIKLFSKANEDVTAVIKNTTEETRRLEKAAAMKDLESKYRRAFSEELKEITATSARLQKELNFATQADRASQSFDNITNSFVNFDRSSRNVLTDLSNSFELVRRGGDKLTATRQVLFGIGEASSTSARLFDALSGTIQSLSANRVPKLTKALRSTASQMSDVSIAVNVANDRFKELAKSESLGTFAKANFNELTNQIKNVTNEYQRLQRIAETNGKVTQAEIDRVKVEYQALQKTIEIARLETDQLGDEGKEAFDKLVSSVSSSNQAIALLEAQNNAILKQEEKKILLAEKTESKSVPIWKRFFAIFRTGSKDVDAARASIQKTSQVSEGFRDILFTLTGGVLGAGIAIGIGSTFDALSTKITGAIQAASNANEEFSKFSVVFDSELDPAVGESDYLVQQMIGSLDELAERLGRSRNEMYRFAAQFQDTFVPLGFGREAASELSLSLTELTQDLSSFYNISESETADRISSFLVGNFENARRFGVIVNDAQLQAELLEMGIEGGTRAVDQQVKSLVALKLLYEGTRDAKDDVVRTSESFANQLREIQGRALDASISLGQKLLPTIEPLLALFLRLTDDIGPRLTEVFNNLTLRITPRLKDLTSAISSGDMEEAFNVIIDVVSGGITKMSDILNEFIPFGAEWAWNWGIEIYNGLINVANTLIADAMNVIASVISDFLEPGSPPKKGPLSTIDKWGVGLMQTLEGGFQKSKVDLLASILDPVANSLQGSGRTGEFNKIKNQLAGLIEDLTSGIEVSDSEIDSLLSGVVPEDELNSIKQTVRQQAELIKLEQQLEKAKESGDLKAIRSLENQIEDQQALISENEQRYSALEQLASLEERVAKASEDGVKSIAPALAGATKAQKAYRESALDTYNREKDELDILYQSKLALVETDEERLELDRWRVQQLQNIENKYYKSRENLDKQASATRLAEYENELREIDGQLEKFKKTGAGDGIKDKLGLDDLGLEVADFLPDKDEIADGVFEFAIPVADNFVLGFSERLEQKRQDVVDSISKLISDSLKDVEDFLKNLSFGEAILVSLLGGLIAIPVVGIITTLGGAIAGLVGGVGALASILGTAAVVGGSLYLIFSNITAITETLSDIIGPLIDPIKEFAANVAGIFTGFLSGGSNEPSEAFAGIEEILESVITLVGTLFNEFTDLVNLFLPSGGIASITGFFAGVIEGINNFIDKLGGAREVGANLQGIVVSLIDSGTQLISGNSAFNPEGPLGAVIGIISSIATTWSNSIQSIFENSDILNRVWQTLTEIFNLALPILKEIAIIVGAALAIALNVVLSALEGLGAALPFIVGAFDGLVTTVQGVVQVISGFVDILSGVVLFIKGIFTGDLTQAFDLLESGAGRVAEGFQNVILGFGATIANLGAGILVFVNQFIGSFITNIASFFGTAGMQFAAGTREWANTFNTFATDTLEQVTTTMQQIPIIFGYMITESVKRLRAWVDEILGPFYTVYDELVGNSIVPVLVDDIIAYIASLGPGIVDAIVTMTPTLISSFLQLGKDLLSGLVGGLGDSGLISSITNAISGLFGGSNEEEQASGEGEGSNFLGSITQMQTGFSGFVTLVNQSILNMQLAWSAFLTYITTEYTNYISAISQDTISFTELYLTAATTMNDFILQLINTVVALGDETSAALTKAVKATETNIEVLTDLIEVVKKVTEAYIKMADAAAQAARAASGALGSSGQVPLGSFASGTMYVPKTGIYKLHESEVVLNPSDSKIFRKLLGSLNVGGLSGIRDNAIRGLERMGSSQISTNQNAEVNIYANYQSQGAATITDDVALGMRLAGYGI